MLSPHLFTLIHKPLKLFSQEWVFVEFLFGNEFSTYLFLFEYVGTTVVLDNLCMNYMTVFSEVLVYHIDTLFYLFMGTQSPVKKYLSDDSRSFVVVFSFFAHDIFPKGTIVF